MEAGGPGRVEPFPKVGDGFQKPPGFAESEAAEMRITRWLENTLLFH